MLKEQVEKLLQENDIWKRGFKTLHVQKDEFDRCSQELQQLKQMMFQRDEQLRKLQVTFKMIDHHFSVNFVGVPNFPASFPCVCFADGELWFEIASRARAAEQPHSGKV